MLHPSRARLLEYYTDWVNASCRSEVAALMKKWPCKTPPEFREIEDLFFKLERRVVKDPALLGPLTPVRDDATCSDEPAVSGKAATEKESGVRTSRLDATRPQPVGLPADPWAHLLNEPLTLEAVSWINALKAADAEVKRLRGEILQGAVDEMNRRQAAREAEAPAAPVSALTDEERDAVQKHLQNWRYFAVNESLAHLVEIVVNKLWGVR